MAAILTASAMNGGPELPPLPAPEPGLPGSRWEIAEGCSHNSMSCSEVSRVLLSWLEAENELGGSLFVDQSNGLFRHPALTSKTGSDCRST